MTHSARLDADQSPGEEREENWEADRPDIEHLIINIDGFEGPLDVLLTLARSQKVDLTQISIAALCSQYLSFIHASRRLNIELAADYLVMAAWLVLLKSRLILPQETSGAEEEDDQSAEALTHRLRRLAAMRDAYENLQQSKILGRDVFARGERQMDPVQRKIIWDARLYDLLDAYAKLHERRQPAVMHIAKRNPWSAEETKNLLLNLVSADDDWAELSSILNRYKKNASKDRSLLASSLAAALELVKRGNLAIRQAGPMRPIYLRQEHQESQEQHGYQEQQEANPERSKT